MPARHLVPDLGRLYRLPLSEFTAARNAMAAELRAAGRKIEAEEVRKAPKPSPSAWAVSCLFAEDREAMRALSREGERSRALADPAQVRAALAEALRRVEELRGRAAQILTAAGHAASDAHLARVADTLRALAFDPAAGDAAARGWLAQDLEPPGFDLLAGLQLAAQPAPPAAKSAGAPVRATAGARPAAGKERHARQEDAAELARRRAVVVAAEREVEQAASRADFQRRRAERAAAEAETAKRRVEEARQLAKEAGGAARSAAEAATEAEAALERARAALASARRKD